MLDFTDQKRQRCTAGQEERETKEINGDTADPHRLSLWLTIGRGGFRVKLKLGPRSRRVIDSSIEVGNAKPSLSRRDPEHGFEDCYQDFCSFPPGFAIGDESVFIGVQKSARPR